MEPEEKTEEQLAAELEAMYKWVAAIEKPDEANDQGYEIQVPQPDEARALTLSTAAAVETAGIHAAEIPLAPPQSPLPDSDRRRIIPGALAAVIVCVCVLLYGAIFWPTLYDTASISTGDKIYPIRINRITGNVFYFDGEQWRNAPVPATYVPVAVAPAPEASVPAPAAPVAVAPLTAQTATLPQQAALQDRRQAPAPVASQAKTQAASAHPSKQTTSRGAATDSLFAIQIKSFDNPADAWKLVEDLRKTGMETDSVAVPVGARGIWNRVLIGRFKDPTEALKFMQKHKIKGAYPDSFIQKRSP